KRELMSHNSWMHNRAYFVHGERATNYLYIHPDDAARHGFTDGQRVRVRSAGGSVEVPLRVTSDMMKGAVALPHGWGHDTAAGLRVARTTTGGKASLLVETGPDALEPLSGMAHYNGLFVTLSATSTPASE